MPSLRLTHIGTATVLLEIGSLRILTDPAFDPAGSRYKWAPIGASSTKLEDPALSPDHDAMARFDAILVTHAQHDDNLDATGRTLFDRATRILTTRSSARRLCGKTEGLRPWETTELIAADGQKLRVTATPARHGPPLSLPFVGEVIGFLLEWEGQTHGPLYISGDTVWFAGIAEIARRYQIGLALLHMGEAKLPATGPFRLTMDGTQAARAAKALGARTIVPIHYDGWSHFREGGGRAAAERAFEAAGLRDRVRWLEKGVPMPFEM
jgi:L-ascorbate metabolism protein UlaG (beta-lactamase superfamily)